MLTLLFRLSATMLLVATLALAACAGPKATPSPTPDQFTAFCTSIGAWDGCVDGIVTLLRAGAWGELFAVCEYADGSGDGVLIDTEGEAAEACARYAPADGMASRVLGIARLPKKP